MLILGVVATSAYFLTPGGKPADPGTPSAEAMALSALAVLPFENVGGDPKTEYLSDGVADHIINSLSQVRRQDLQVRPFTSVARFRRQRPDAPTIGRELKVQMLVTGTLHQQGNHLVIRVAVVDALEDNQLWGESYEGKLGGILELQDRIVRDVAANLRLGLTDEEERRLTKRSTAEPEAYLLFREGMFHWNKFTPEGIQTGIEYFQRAIKKDPNYALAFAGLGRAYILLGTQRLGLRQTHAEAKKNLTRALEIDNTLLAAHSGLGLISMFHDWNWPEAKRHLQQAFDLDSSAPSENCSIWLRWVGRAKPSSTYDETKRRILSQRAAETNSPCATTGCDNTTLPSLRLRRLSSWIPTFPWHSPSSERLMFSKGSMRRPLPCPISDRPPGCPSRTRCCCPTS